MNIIDIIAKKMDKQILTKQEIEFFINGYNNGDITECQVSALIMAICINGITDEEMANLALAMANSGEILDLSGLGNNVVNIHTTNGIDDKIALILITVMASLGVPVAKLCEDTQGLTGGIISKLQCIPKLNIKMDIQEFIENIQDISVCIIGEVLDIAPADKKISVLKPTISCDDNLSLMAVSIMSKEFSKGANNIIVHIPVGNGTVIKKETEARKLGEKIIKIGKIVGRKVVCVITDMSQPIGYSLGNTLEVIETIEALKGKMQDDVKQIVLELGAQLIKLYKKGNNIEENKAKIVENLENNKAFDKFVELIENQGGDISYIKNIEKFKTAEYIVPVTTDKRGFVKKINTEQLQKLCYELGAGKMKQQDKIDNKVGIIVIKKIEDRIEEGDTLGFIHTNNIQDENRLVETFRNCYEISDKYAIKPKIILGIME